ncbi:hypothetical protein KW849_18635 [Pseudomonas sp. PDM26]|uniref:hypothetical protein n=1 Tax=Pseudomonas sp. PDM26 TaxID=2854766 RepID=UPI001C443778|nr:hypothetical protein [Pseudomonas sp. PDM26]MBV7548303.1 hypothetical protein [Pseudomonas sp. PDM26]
MTECPQKGEANLLFEALSSFDDIAWAFVSCWRIACKWLPSDLTNSDAHDFDRCADFSASLEQDATDFIERLKVHLSQPLDGPFLRGVILDAMKVLDQFFLRIHPRSLTLSPAVRAAVNLPTWLIKYRQDRLTKGKYWSDDVSYLVPRGPLCRKNRGEFESSGESLLDRFSALSVVPCSVKIYDTPFQIEIKVVQPGVDSGVSVVSEFGLEKFAAIPVGEDKEDISFEERTAFGSNRARYFASPNYDVVEAVIGVLHQCKGIDVAVASEFLVHEEHANEICARLHEVDAAPNVFVAGSGNTVSQLEGQSWNESRVVNSLGIELWRQRKLWPSGISCVAATKYGMADPGSATVKEDNKSGSTLFIVDLDGVGRCVVLICQDLQAMPMAEDVVVHYQPDWVFTPILDTGVSVGRWGHQRAFSLSNRSQAKFAIVSSLSLSKYWPDPGEGHCAMLVGPLEPKDKHTPKRTYALLKCDSGHTPGWSVIQWGSEDPRWRASDLK